MSEASRAQHVQRPFQQVNSVLELSESVSNMMTKIKKAEKIHGEVEQLEEAIEDLKERAASKKKEIKALKDCKDYLSFTDVSFSYTTKSFI